MSLETCSGLEPALVKEEPGDNFSVEVDGTRLDVDDEVKQEPEVGAQELLKPTAASAPVPILETTTIDNIAIKVEQYSLRDCSVVVKFEQLDETHQCSRCDNTFAHESILQSHKCSGEDDSSEADGDMPDVGLETEADEDVNTESITVGGESLEPARCHGLTPRGCFVKLERVNLHALLMANRSSHAASGKESDVEKDTNGVQYKYKSTYKCNYCGRIFDRKSLLVKHVVWHMSELSSKETHTGLDEYKRAYYTCHYCDKRFALKTLLVEHILCHMNKLSSKESNIEDNGVDEHKGVYICDHCGKIFDQKQLLVKHVWRHLNMAASKRGYGTASDVPVEGPTRTKEREPNETRKKPITCEECSQTFVREWAFEKHKCYAQFSNKKDSKLDTADSPKKPECKICETRFKSNKTLKRHQLICKMVSCDVCGRNVKKSDLEGHKRFHSADTLYTCHICEKGFTALQSLKMHLLIHTGKKQFSCDICGKTFVHSANLRSHKLVHTDEKPYVCDLCENTFRHLSSLKKHIVNHTSDKSILSNLLERYKQPKSPKIYLCHVCKKEFSFKSQLKLHKSVHTEEKPYACKICGQKFSFKCNFNKHNQRIHQNKKSNVPSKVYSCKICKKEFKKLRSFKDHESAHMGDNDKQYACKVCGKKFASRNGLDAHSGTHTGGFRCDICEKKFAQPQTLKRHKQLIHTEGVKCKVCGKLVSKHSLKSHERYHDGKYPCEICEKGYETYGILKGHLLIHTGEKPFACDMCPSRFLHKTLLLRHKQTHQ